MNNVDGDRESAAYRRYLCTEQHFAPNHAQLSKAVMGHDPKYRIRPKRSIYRSYLILVFAVLLAVFGTFFVIASAR